MVIIITDMNGHKVKLSRPNGMKFGLNVDITLNDGSDPTRVQLIFDSETTEALGNALGFFS